jgi:hypothetical protein
LGIKSTKRRFDRWADANDSFFHAWTKERDPKMTAKEQPRPTRGRGTARMRSTVKVHPFHRRRCWIKDRRPIRTKPILLLHLTIKTRHSPRLDVGFMKEARAGSVCIL